MVKVGQKVSFNPFRGINSFSDVTRFNNTEGTVKYVNAKHRWFSVEWGETNSRTSFVFHDIGNSVNLIAD